MQVKCWSGHPDDETHVLVDADRDKHLSVGDRGSFCGWEIHGEPNCHHVVLRSFTGRQIRLNGNYMVSVMLTRNEIAELARVAWGQCSLADFVSAMCIAHPATRQEPPDDRASTA